MTDQERLERLERLERHMKLALRVLLLFVIWGGADRHEYEGKLSKAMREYD